MDDLNINMYAFRERLVWEHFFFYAQECENILMFGRWFEATILGRKIEVKTFPPPLMGIQHSHGKGIFSIMKRPKYPYHHPKPPALAAVHRRR